MIQVLKEVTEQVLEEIKQDFKEREDGRNITMLLENKVGGRDQYQLSAEYNLTRARVCQLCSPIAKKLGRILPARKTKIESCLDGILGRENLLYLPEAIASGPGSEARSDLASGPGSKPASSAGNGARPADGTSSRVGPGQSGLGQDRLRVIREAIRLYNFCTDRKLYLVAESFISRHSLAEIKELLAAKISKGGPGLSFKEVKKALGSTGLSQAGLGALLGCLRHYQPYEGRVYHAFNKNEVAAVILWAYYPAGFNLKEGRQLQEFKEIFEEFVQTNGLNHTSKAMETLFKNKQQYAVNLGNQVYIHKAHLEVDEEALEGVRAFIDSDLEVMEETNIQRLYPEFKGRPGFELIKSETMFFGILKDRFGDKYVFHNRDRILPDKMRGKKIKTKGQLIEEYIESHDGKVKQKETWRHFAKQYGWHRYQSGKQVCRNDSIDTIREHCVKYLVIY